MSGKRVANSPAERIPPPKKVINMPPKKPTASIDPQVDGTRIIFETFGINDKEFFGVLTEEEILYIWEKVLGRSAEDIFGMSYKRSMNRYFRVTVVLNGQLSIQDFFPAPTFVYRRRHVDAKTDDDYDSIHCRLIGYDRVEPVKLGQLARVTVSTCDFTVAPADIVKWLAKFGSVSTNYCYVKNSIGLRTDTIETEIHLQKHVPEFLPVAGKKVQVAYPGIPKACIKCYRLGHMKRNCKQPKMEWIDRVNELRKTGDFEDSLFGSWIAILDQ